MFTRIQLFHQPQSDNKPYQPPEFEEALKKLNLPELAGPPFVGAESQEGIIRHETGPEIIVLLTSLVSLTTAIISLVNAIKKVRPETKIQVTVDSAEKLEQVLNVLKRR